MGETSPSQVSKRNTIKVPQRGSVYVNHKPPVAPAAPLYCATRTALHLNLSHFLSFFSNRASSKKQEQKIKQQ